jgi:hypothetical protein
MAHIATRTIKVTNAKTRKVKVIIEKGTTYSAAQMRRIPTKYHCYMTSHSTRATWTDGEIELIAKSYHELTDAANNNENANDIIAAFRTEYDTHSDAAIIMMIAQAKAIDTYYDAVGLNYNKYLVECLNDIDSTRYYV